MNLPTELLRTFVTIADLGSFTRAGDKIGRSQPAISLQIKRLESLLQARLYDRTSRDMVLSSAGKQLVGYCLYTHLRAHETKANLVCRLLLEKKKKNNKHNKKQSHQLTSITDTNISPFLYIVPSIQCTIK